MADNPSKNNVQRGFKRQRRFVIKLNFFSIFLLSSLVFFGYSFLSSLNQPSIGNQVTFDEFISGVKGNKYAQVDVRDDGMVVAYEKYLFVTNQAEGLKFEDKEGTDFVNNLEEVGFNELIEKIDPSKNVSDKLTSIFDKDRFRVREVLIGDNFVIIKQENADGGDLIIKDMGEDAFKQALSDKDLLVTDITPQITYLRSAGDLIDKDRFKRLDNNDNLSDIWAFDNVFVGRSKNEQIKKDFTSVAPLNTDLLTYLQEEGVNLDSGNLEVVSVEIPIVPWGDIITIIILVGIGGLIFFLFRGIQGSSNSLMKFGQTKAGLFFGRKPETTFKDVAGVDEAKEELKEVVMFLKDPKKFLKMGARIPKGLLLVGQPGTGKTLLARAIAGEAGVPFFHTSGSEFEEMLVGAGASRVRDLFEKAKKASPALIFIDEIDAVARKRGTTIQSSSTEQTLNQILVEMDGFEKKDNVIVIAATNRPDVLDPAILRPGRFDRRVVLDLPDKEGRMSIIKIHAKNKPLAADVNLETVAKRTVGFSGADIENMLNEAAIIAAKADKLEITAHDIEEAATKVAVGPERKRKRNPEELKLTAYHEVGHALVARKSDKTDPVHRITIVSRGMSLGSTMQLPQEDKVQQTKVEMESRIRVLLGGRAAEELIFGDITSGASNDIEKATSIARKMVKLFGMSKSLGLVKYGDSNELQYLGYGYGEQRDYSEKTAELIDAEVRDIIQDEYVKAKKIIQDNEAILHKISEDLLKKEVMEADEFEHYFKDSK